MTAIYHETVGFYKLRNNSKLPMLKKNPKKEEKCSDDSIPRNLSLPKVTDCFLEHVMVAFYENSTAAFHESLTVTF